MLQQLTRALRRRTERELAKLPPAIEADRELVLDHPAHFHACLTTYHGVDDEGKFTFPSHFDLITNDLTLAKSQAVRLSGRPNVHVNEAKECRDTAHVGGGSTNERDHRGRRRRDDDPADHLGDAERGRGDREGLAGA